MTSQTLGCHDKTLLGAGEGARGADPKRGGVESDTQSRELHIATWCGKATHVAVACPAPPLQQAELVLLCFDPHRVDISDEMKLMLKTLMPHESKVRVR
eukprot:44504-Chlamydomonas_euryale.AAC.1